MVALLPPILFVCFYTLNMADAILLSEKLNGMKETLKGQNVSYIDSKTVIKVNTVNEIKEIAENQDLFVKKEYPTNRIKEMSNDEKKTINRDLILNPKPAGVKNKKISVISVKNALISTVQQASEKVNETLKGQNTSYIDSKLVSKVNPVNKIKEIIEDQIPHVIEEDSTKEKEQLHPVEVKVYDDKPNSPISPHMNIPTKKKSQWHPMGIRDYLNHTTTRSQHSSNKKVSQPWYMGIAAGLLICVIFICLYLRYAKTDLHVGRFF